MSIKEEKKESRFRETVHKTIETNRLVIDLMKHKDHMDDYIFLHRDDLFTISEELWMMFRNDFLNG